MPKIADGYGLKPIYHKERKTGVILSIFEGGVIHRIVLPPEHPIIQKLEEIKGC